MPVVALIIGTQLQCESGESATDVMITIAMNPGIDTTDMNCDDQWLEAFKSVVVAFYWATAAIAVMAIGAIMWGLLSLEDTTWDASRHSLQRRVIAQRRMQQRYKLSKQRANARMKARASVDANVSVNSNVIKKGPKSLISVSKLHKAGSIRRILSKSVAKERRGSTSVIARPAAPEPVPEPPESMTSPPSPATTPPLPPQIKIQRRRSY